MDTILTIRNGHLIDYTKNNDIKNIKLLCKTHKKYYFILYELIIQYSLILNRPKIFEFIINKFKKHNKPIYISLKTDELIKNCKNQHILKLLNSLNDDGYINNQMSDKFKIAFATYKREKIYNFNLFQYWCKIPRHIKIIIAGYYSN